jgi:hypothetical protein
MPLQPSYFLRDSAYMVRLHLGKALSGVKHVKQRLQAAKAVYSAVQPVGQQLREDVSSFAAAIQCSPDLAAATAEIRLLVRRTPEAIASAKAAVTQQFQLGGFRVPASLQVVQQPAGTIQLLLCNPPPGLV